MPIHVPWIGNTSAMQHGWAAVVPLGAIIRVVGKAHCACPFTDFAAAQPTVTPLIVLRPSRLNWLQF